MIYDFKCDCGNTDVAIASIEDGPPKDFKCTECGELMYQQFSGSIHIPDWMKATEEGDHFTSLNEKMRKSRPSGRGKVYY